MLYLYGVIIIRCIQSCINIYAVLFSFHFPFYIHHMHNLHETTQSKHLHIHSTRNWKTINIIKSTCFVFLHALVFDMTLSWIFDQVCLCMLHFKMCNNRYICVLNLNVFFPYKSI